MLRTILILIITLIVLPIVAITMDQPLEGPYLEALFDILHISLGAAMICFLLSEFTGNYSQVDKLWSLLPIAYVWFFTVRSGMEPRLMLMATLVTIWGLRLTWNFSRRGGYSWKFWLGEEDYRWAELRAMPMFSKKWRFMLFNLFFISLYQHHLILLFTLPILVAWQGAETPLGWLDYLATALMLAFIWMETVADNEHYRFQTEKYRQIESGERRTGEFADGFLQSGLWACFRHPNYTAEQAIWLSFYLFSVSATDRWLNWSLAGALLLLLLFRGSADFSEKISASKYPAYASYQKRVGRFLPKIF